MALSLPTSSDPYWNGWQGVTTQPSRDDDDPSVPDPAYWVQAQRWAAITACLEGTPYLRQHAGQYLPQAPMELDDAWNGRVSRSVFSPYFEKLARLVTGLIMRKPIRLDGDDWWTDEFSLDVDRQGTPLEEFVRQRVFDAVTYGHSSWLVDFPDARNVRTLRDQVEADLRPYFVPVDVQNLVGWRSDIRENAGKLTQVRIREVAAVPKGRFGVEYKNRVRVLEPGKFELYEAQGERGNTGWQLIESGRLSVKDIPLVSAYGAREGVLQSKPPLYQVAHLNLSHYSVQADLRQALFVAAQPLLILRGFDDQADPVGLSVNNALILPPEGGAEYVSCDSGAFQPLQDELQRLVDEMKTLGLAILNTPKNEAESGVAKALDRTDSNAVLAVISQSVEQGLQQAFDLAGEYLGREAPIVSLERDFDVQIMDGTAVSAVNTIFTSGLIDQMTALQILKRGEWLDDAHEPEEIMAAAETEQLASMEQEMEKLEVTAEIAAKHNPKPAPQAPPKGK